MAVTGEAEVVLAALAVLYVLLIGDWFHRAWAALGVAGALVVSGIISWHEALYAINRNTLALLMGMMLLVGLLGEAGVFEDLGTRMERWAAGNPWRLLWVFYTVTAVVSAVLDNVTTVLLLSPALFRAADGLGIDPVPLLMVEVVGSNLGGLATLVGDPPNILIGTAANLTFSQFVRLLGPPALLLVVGVAAVIPRIVRIRPAAPATGAIPARREEYPLRSRQRGLLIILGLVLIALLFQRPLGVTAGEIAVAGAAVAMAYTLPPVGPLMRFVDWGTLGFFVGIFVLVGALEHGGVLRQLAASIGHGQAGPWLPLVILVASAGLSAVMDNVPLVAAMIPVVQSVLRTDPGYGSSLWVALAMGSVIGGNATIIGASANVVVQGLAAESGYRLDFRRYLPFGLAVGGVSLLLGSVYVVAVH